MTIRSLFLRGTFVLSSVFLAFGTSQAGQTGDRYYDVRSVVERAQSDLQTARTTGPDKGDQRSRYDNAERHLSTFDRHLLKGHFDKGELSTAIQDLQHILDKNTLSPESRDALTRNIQDLRAVRRDR